VPRDWFTLRQVDAVARCGFGDGYLWRGYDFDDPAQFETVQGGGGSTTLRTASAGGTLDVTTGSAATSYILPARIGGATGNYPAFTPTGSAPKWYAAVLIDVATVCAADGRIGMFGRDPASGDVDWVLGVEGAESTTKYAIYGTTGAVGASVLSTTSVAAGFKLLEAWRVGTLTHLAVDGVEEGTPADVYADGVCGVCFGGSGGTAVSAIASFEAAIFVHDTRPTT